MAALYESYTLCTLEEPGPAGGRAVEPDSDGDRVIVTESGRAVTVYKVSDQKPLGSWAVKQGQCITCPAVCNYQTKEFVVVTDEKVIRVWKYDDISIEKAFKATVSAEVYRVHSVPGWEPVVLFRCGAVRFLDSLLSAPQQPVEVVLSEEEVIRWSTAVKTEQHVVLLFSTEQRGEHYLCVQRFSPNTLVKYRLKTEASHSSPLSFAATYRDGNIHLIYLFSNGCIWESVIQTQRTGLPVSESVQALPHSVLLQLPVGKEKLTSASALPVDESHVAVVGVPHPSAGTGKDFLCLWNTHFQTLQAGRELAGMIYGQLWCYSGKLFVPHGKSLSVIPFECQKSSLASAVGKLKTSGTDGSKGPTFVASWTTLLYGEAAETMAKTRVTQNLIDSHCQDFLMAKGKQLDDLKVTNRCLTAEELTENIKVGSVTEVQKAMDTFLCELEQEKLQLTAGRLASELVARCQADSSFYPQATLMQLVKTNYVCHSLCPDLLMLALEKKDYTLCQLCLQLFHDVPEPITCACLKTILSVQDAELEQVDLEACSLEFMENLAQTTDHLDERSDQRNGFGLQGLEEESCEDSTAQKKKPATETSALDMSCPVGIHKGVLINEVLQTPYSDNLLLPHLKDLTVPQVILLLKYLRFLYLKYTVLGFGVLQKPTLAQLMDWICLMLDAHFTVLVLVPEAKEVLSSLHMFVRSHIKLYSELGKIEGSLEALKKAKQSNEIGQYSIEVVELF